jgi:hypothetical protein
MVTGQRCVPLARIDPRQEKEIGIFPSSSVGRGKADQLAVPSAARHAIFSRIPRIDLSRITSNASPLFLHYISFVPDWKNRKRDQEFE